TRCREAQLLSGVTAVSIKSRRVTRTSWLNDEWNWAAGNAFDCLDYFKDRGRLPRTKVGSQVRIPLPQIIDCFNVNIGQVGHVDIVAQATPVHCVMIVSVDGKTRELPTGCKEGTW